MEKTKIADKKFFLDAFNNILDYGDNKVTILFDTKGDIWFGLKDMLKILGYTDAKHGIDDIKLNQKFKKKFVNLKVAGFIPPPNFQKNTFFINESGLYELLTKSNKPMAKQFLNKYLTEIMPQIRKTGQFISNKSDMDKIKKLNNKIENYKTELNYYDTKYKFEPSVHGYLYISENNQIKNGIKIKCYKIGYDIDMNKRVALYRVGNFKYKLIAYIPLKIDRKQIEQCVKSRLKPHLTKLFTDTVCYMSLTELKKEIIECINFTSQHICHCIKCSLDYKLNLLDKHNCNIQKTSNIIDYKYSKKSSKKSSKKISKKSSKKSTKKKSKKSSGK